MLKWLGKFALLVAFGYCVQFLIQFVPDSATWRWPLTIASVALGAVGLHLAKRNSTSLNLNRPD